MARRNPQEKEALSYTKDRRNDYGENQAALRKLGNRLVGILHGCLKNGTRYNEATAWTHPQPAS